MCCTCYLLAGEDDKLILCDECNKAFHLFCLRPALYEVPDGEWQCPACQPATARRNSRGRWEFLLLLKTNKLISSCCVELQLFKPNELGSFKFIFCVPTPLFKELQWVGEWCSKGSDLIFSLWTFLVFITSHVLYFLGHPFFSNNISPSVFYFHFAHFLISDDFCSHLLLKVMKLITFLTCTYSLPSLAWLEFGCQLGHLPLPCLCIAKCYPFSV